MDGDEQLYPAWMESDDADLHCETRAEMRSAQQEWGDYLIETGRIYQ